MHFGSFTLFLPHSTTIEQVDGALRSSLPYPHCRGLRQRWMIRVFANKVSFCSRFSVGWPRLNTDSIMVWTYQPCIYFLYTGKLYIKFPPLLTTVSITDTWEGWLCLSWVYDPRLGALLSLSPPPERPVRLSRGCKSPIGGLHLLLSSREKPFRLSESVWPPDFGGSPLALNVFKHSGGINVRGASWASQECVSLPIAGLPSCSRPDNGKCRGDRVGHRGLYGHAD